MNHSAEEKADAILASSSVLPKGKKSKKNLTNKQDKPSSNEESNKLTEKQLRKLEWEKKLAEGLKAKAPDVDGTVSKAELREKRRLQQEAQRQAKALSTIKPTVNKQSQPQESPKLTPAKPIIKTSIEVEKKTLKKPHNVNKPNLKQVQLVRHLYVKPNSELQLRAVNFKGIPPVFVKLGVQYSEKVILGSNARSLALLAAVKGLISEIQIPPKQEFCRYVEAVLGTCTNYLQGCRPMAVSMTNALRAFKLQLRSIDTSLSDNQKRATLLESIDTYINNDIKKAWDAICLKVNTKIVNGDVILTYGCSSLIRNILLLANDYKKKFSVIIVDSRPLLEGREMLRRLVSAGIKCSYVLINGLSWAMRHSTKVLLGAHALLANGSVMSRIGTAQVALVAQAYNKPVLVCCETYKFSERVQTDSFVYNEIGDPERLLSIDTSSTPSPLRNQTENPKLNILNLLYDVTPPDLVTAVVTELAVLPCTSVPVVLRIAGENAV
ncbi:translation initiation factor eIF2B subunit delta [Euwallacea similis]|uniref:translation initiation factor eIF2B subunit delta n=1 Tax=Euwallacea similis TaxID=1736056 RepID=UPI00344B42B8